MRSRSYRGVMAGFGSAIHAATLRFRLAAARPLYRVDDRRKAGHDGGHQNENF